MVLDVNPHPYGGVSLGQNPVHHRRQVTQKTNQKLRRPIQSRRHDRLARMRLTDRHQRRIGHIRRPLPSRHPNQQRPQPLASRLRTRRVRTCCRRVIRW